MRNHRNTQSPRTRRIAAGAAALLVTGVLGTVVAVPALTSGDDPASPPAAAVPSPPAPVIGRRADEALRWSQFADRTRLELCTAAPISADGLEHCIEGGR